MEFLVDCWSLCIRRYRNGIKLTLRVLCHIFTFSSVSSVSSILSAKCRITDSLYVPSAHLQCPSVL